MIFCHSNKSIEIKQKRKMKFQARNSAAKLLKKQAVLDYIAVI